MVRELDNRQHGLSILSRRNKTPVPLPKHVSKPVGMQKELRIKITYVCTFSLTYLTLSAWNAEDNGLGQELYGTAPDGLHYIGLILLHGKIPSTKRTQSWHLKVGTHRGLLQQSLLVYAGYHSAVEHALDCSQSWQARCVRRCSGSGYMQQSTHNETSKKLWQCLSTLAGHCRALQFHALQSGDEVLPMFCGTWRQWTANYFCFCCFVSTDLDRDTD